MNLDVEVEYPNIAGSRVGEVMEYLRDRTRMMYVDLNVGALVNHKGQKFLVEAIAQVRRQIPDAQLVIFGEGDLPSTAEHQH